LVSLNLAQKVIIRRPAVDRESTKMHTCFHCHELNHVAYLESDSFKGGASDVCARCAAGDPDDQSTSEGIPVGRC
jgi:hypothetical protein